ncbi:hypothetical protein QFC21_006368 [Naganishia friedmannii]|uniref:Uncharacterized protein n=1 Tax=Naganishia friedmannii TaxID=89922 RepID=A0ACC2V2G8_9TREE|nr:hypothetical protein QFC21_006368 [Naganishia friedmannii]
MMWAHSGVSPVLVQGGSGQDAAGAAIKMHDAFGTFGIDLGKQFVGEDEGEDAGGAGAGAGAGAEKDDLKGKRRKMVIRAHAVVMTIAWIVTAPIAVLFARYGRGAFKWVPYHQYLQIGGTAPLALVGFFLAVSAVVMRGGKSFQGAHEVGRPSATLTTGMNAR